jgi:hypothetical protein
MPFGPKVCVLYNYTLREKVAYTSKRGRLVDFTLTTLAQFRMRWGPIDSPLK